MKYLPGEMLEPCAYLYQVTDTGFGGTTTQISTETGPVKLDASLSKTKMPEHVREALKKIKGENDGNKKT